MTENIFENGGQFCMRGDPDHKPVEWHWFKTDKSKFCVMYLKDNLHLRTSLDGIYSADGKKSSNDLIPIPSPPKIVPWESPDDVPDGIWIRCKHNGNLYQITGFENGFARVGTAAVLLRSLLKDWEYHTNRKADDGWQPCGKVVQ